MAIDWIALAKQVGGLGQDGGDLTIGTEGGRRAVELLLGEDNLRDAVDCWIEQSPGFFTAEMVLRVIRSKVAAEYCYERYKTAGDSSEVASAATLLLSEIATDDAMPWIIEFFDDSREAIRWNGLMALQTILYEPISDGNAAIARELLDRADKDPHPEMRKRVRHARNLLEKRERGE